MIQLNSSRITHIIYPRTKMNFIEQKISDIKNAVSVKSDIRSKQNSLDTDFVYFLVKTENNSTPK
jgi:hypothetical protein